MVKTILIVEDDKEIQYVYKQMLEDYNIHIVNNTDDAWDFLQTCNVDLVILDIILPREQGDVFFKKIRKEKKFSDLKFLVVSVLDDAKEDIKKIDSSVEFISKPFDKEDLKKKIEDLLK